MCYDITYLTKRQLDYANRYGRKEDFDDIKKRLPAVYHTNGFQHKSVPVISSEDDSCVKLYEWGLIPFWTNRADLSVIQNKTLNARGETIFSKPAFKRAAASNRCIVIVDGFFEHHHVKGKAIPYFISKTNNEPFSLGGIWDSWDDVEKGIVRYTFSIVTTEANKRMAEIHNNPKVLKRGGPRMPLIIPKEEEAVWLSNEMKKVDIQNLIKSYPQSEFQEYTVGPLRGKNYTGDNEKAHLQYNYPELLLD